MMLFLFAAQAIGTVTFEPTLVFPGEPFSVLVSIPEDHTLQTFGERNVRLSEREQSRRYRGNATGPASFWFQMHSPSGQIVDAAQIEVPVVLVPRWRDWPQSSGKIGEVAFLVGLRKVALVPVAGNIGVVAAEDGREARYPRMLEFDIAARSGPRRIRSFVPDYLYAGSSHITVLARPHDLARVSAVVTEAGVEVRIVAHFDLRGSVRVLGEEHTISLRQAEAATLTKKL